MGAQLNQDRPPALKNKEAIMLQVSVYIIVNNRPRVIYSENVQIDYEWKIGHLHTVAEEVLRKFCESNPELKPSLLAIKSQLTTW